MAMTEEVGRFELIRQEIQQKLDDEGVEVSVPHPDSPRFLDFMTTFQTTHPHYARRLLQGMREDPEIEVPEADLEHQRPTLRDRMGNVSRALFMRQSADGDYVLDKRKSGIWAMTALISVAGGYLLLSSLPAKQATSQASTASPQTPGPQATTRPATESTTLGQRQDTSGAFLGETNRDDTAATDDSQTANASDTTAGTPGAGDDPFARTSATSSTGGSTVADSQPTAPTIEPPEPPQAFRTVQSDPFATSAAAPARSTGAPLPEPSPTLLPDSSTPVVVTPPAPTATGPADNPFAEAPAQAAPTPLDATPVPVAPAPRQTAVAPTPEPFGETAAPTPSATVAQDAPRSAVVYQSQTTGSGQTPGTAARPSAVVAGGAGTGGAAEVASPGASGGAGRTGVVVTAPQASERRSAVVYTAQTQATATSPTASTPQTQAATAATAAQEAQATVSSPYTPTQLVQARLVTSIYSTSGQAVPVVAQVPEGNLVGRAVLNAQMGRVEMQFDTLVKDGKTYPVDGLAYQNVEGNLVSGLSAAVKDVAPNLASDLIRSGINGLNTYAQQLAQSGTTTVTGGVVTTTQRPPDLLTVLRGQLAGVFALPQGQQAFVTVGQVPTGTPFLVMMGVKPEQGAGSP